MSSSSVFEAVVLAAALTTFALLPSWCDLESLLHFPPKQWLLDEYVGRGILAQITSYILLEGLHEGILRAFFLLILSNDTRPEELDPLKYLQVYKIISC